MRSTRSFADTSPARGVALVGALTALGCVLALAETVLLPPLPVPGVRLGLANLAVVIALAVLGRREALAVALGRVLLVGAFAGTLGGPGFAMALSGALCSWGVMAALSLAGERFSPAGWSVAGAAAHLVAQLAVAAILTSAAAVVALVPLSLTLAVVSGLAVGQVARLLLSRLPLVSAEVVR